MTPKKPPITNVNFIIDSEYLGSDGLWNPRDGDPPMEGGLQINLFGSREHYLKLADAIRAFAERDTSTDSDYHEHFQGMVSYGLSLNLVRDPLRVGD